MKHFTRSIGVAALALLGLAVTSLAAARYLVLYLPPQSSVPIVYYATVMRPAALGFKVLVLSDGKSVKVEEPRINAVVELSQLSYPTLGSQEDIDAAKKT